MPSADALMSRGTWCSNDLGKDFCPAFLGSDNFEDRARYARATILLKPNRKTAPFARQYSTWAFTSATSKALVGKGKYHFFPRIFILYFCILQSILSTPPMCLLYAVNKFGLGDLLVLPFSSVPSFVL